MQSICNKTAFGPVSMEEECHAQSSITKKGHIRIKSFDAKQGSINRSTLVVVRYFLDRPGYDLHNSAARFWFNPPSTVTPVDVLEYLTKQGIALPGLLVEVYLDRFGSYMLLEACQHNLVEWDFSETSNNIPGILNIRLTDMLNAEQEEVKSEVDLRFPSAQQETKKSIEIANITPSGLFSFSMMVGLETVALMSKMFPELIAESWVISWGPYMFFVGGVMQIIVAVVQTFRNNLYGATAFLGFGTFWFSNGLTAILATHFSGDGTLAQELIDDSDPGGLFFRSLFSFAFTAVLLKQTFVMSKLSTTLISLLCLKIAAGAFTGWFEEFRWLQLIFGVATSGFAFWVFTVELTNQIYHREVFPTYKWSQKHSPEEVFGASGRHGTLHSKAARLRRASYPTVQKVRGAHMPAVEEVLTSKSKDAA